MARRGDAGTLLIGGLLLGAWLAIWVFSGNDAKWLLWGAVGLGLAAATYGARVAEPGVRFGLFVAIGVLTGFLVTYLVLQLEAQGLGALLTFIGGGLIAVGLPSPERGQEAPPSPPAAWAAPPQPAYLHRAAPVHVPDEASLEVAEELVVRRRRGGSARVEPRPPRAARRTSGRK